MSSDTGFFSIIDYTVDGPGTQRALIDAFADIQERRVRSHAGYRSARLLASTDGTRVYNIVGWASEADWRRFDETDDLDERQADIRRALASVPGRAEPRMNGAPRYVLVREVAAPSLSVEVYSDVLCPWCYIGKRRLAAALAGLHDRDRVRITWRSYELGADATTPGPTAAEELAEMWGDEAPARLARIQALGAAEGLALNLHLARPVRSFDAHRLTHIAAADGRGGEMLERLLHAYHTEARDIADAEVLVDLAGDVGLDRADVRAQLAGGAYADAVRADERRAAEQGVRAVPSIAIAGAAPISLVQPVPELRRLLAEALAAA